MSEIILYEKRGNVSILSINRPDALNALNAEVNVGLLDVLEKAEQDDDVKVVVLTGVGGKAFVAGADIKEMLPLSCEEAREHALRSKNVADKLWNMRKPVIAMINGYCLGGGLEYAMACDLRIASEPSKFGLPEITLGIIPGTAGTQRLPRLIGMTKAKEYAMTGEIFNAQKALDLGLINHIYATESLEEETMRIANKIASRGSFALKMIKTAMNHGMETDIETASLFEINCFALCFSTQDQKYGMRSFIEKRREK